MICGLYAVLSGGGHIVFNFIGCSTLEQITYYTIGLVCIIYAFYRNVDGLFD